MRTDADFEEVYQRHNIRLNPNRMFFVGSILSDTQEAMYRKDTETVEDFTSEALYHLRKCQEEGDVTPAYAAKIGQDIIMGKGDYLARMETEKVYPQWDEEEWTAWVQNSCNYLNSAKIRIFALSDKIGRKNWKE